MNSSDHLAARHIGGYTPSLIEERWTGPLHGRLIRTLHLAEKGIPRFRIGHLGRLASVNPLQLVAVRPEQQIISLTKGGGSSGANAMRSVLALGLLITLCASADAATVHRAEPPTVQLRTRQHVIVRPSQGVTAPARFAVPGWTDEQTRYWLDNATSCAGCG
jgi:hypothetical protein